MNVRYSSAVPQRSEKPQDYRGNLGHFAEGAGCPSWRRDVSTKMLSRSQHRSRPFHAHCSLRSVISFADVKRHFLSVCSSRSFRRTSLGNHPFRYPRLILYLSKRTKVRVCRSASLGYQIYRPPYQLDYPQL
jgi:hypothetical protein